MSNELTVKTAFLVLLFNDTFYIMDSETALDRGYADITMIVRPDMRRFELLDFLIDARPPQVQESYRFRVGELLPDRPGILRQDNLSIVIINRSADTIARLTQASAGLQDPDSQDSHQPGFALNPLRPAQSGDHSFGNCVDEALVH